MNMDIRQLPIEGAQSLRYDCCDHWVILHHVEQDSGAHHCPDLFHVQSDLE